MIPVLHYKILNINYQILRYFLLIQAALPFAAVDLAPTTLAASIYLARLHFWPLSKAQLRVHVAHLPLWMMLQRRHRLCPIHSLLLHPIVMQILAHLLVSLVFPIFSTMAILILRFPWLMQLSPHMPLNHPSVLVEVIRFLLFPP